MKSQKKQGKWSSEALGLGKECLTNDEDLFKGNHARRKDREEITETTTTGDGDNPIQTFLDDDLKTFLPTETDRPLFLQALEADGLAL